MSLKKIAKEELLEMSFIEIAHEILVDKKQACSFNDLLKEIGNILELSESEVRSRMVQFYTDLNIDGRFMALGENRWGLRAWYPVDQIEEETVPTIKTRKKKAKKAVDGDEEDFEDLDEEELDYDELDDVDEEDLSDDDDEDFDDDDEDLDDDLEIEDDEYDLDDDEEDEDDDEEDEEQK
ncbi:DNA-directed RNA polymerase subunit delta [Bacillus pakistanensis]|uniref:Probable DNA-directed RNA polymerase subunit delta n=1 Tax=Rossellomorea pakistanensis TaxID=992288 RepID=A0ABS2NBI8_9BACI|nr:DNA-directed RNA polymerase subunit delta [Bacillus pakistanensis]